MSALIRSFRQEWRSIGLWSLLINAGMLMPSLYMLQIYDRVLISHNQLTLLMSTLLLVGMLAMVCLAEMARSRLLVKTGILIDKSMSPELLQASFRAQRLAPLAEPAMALSDLMQVRQFLTGNGVLAFLDAPWVVIYIGVLFVLHPFLGVLALVCGSVLLFLAWLSHNMSSQPAQLALQASQQVQADQQAKLRNAQVIHAMGMLSAVQSQWESLHLSQMLAQQSVENISLRLQAFSKFLRYTQQSLSLAMGAWLVIRGEISPGAMIVANTLMSRALQPLDLLVSTWRPMLSARVSLERIRELLESHPLQPTHGDTSNWVPSLTLSQVSMGVPGRHRHILHDVSFQVQPGQLLCIMGPSGSGKSTLARTLLGIWPHAKGTVLLGGQPVNTWAADWRERRIGYLAQDIELLPGTLAENIAKLGEVDSEKVVAAARQVGIHDMILRFPQGYNTNTADAGILLSAGQKQRLGLARALYGETDFLVLDEPNAHLDDASENVFLTTLRSLKSQGKTVLLITHRKPIVQIADLLLIIGAGRVQDFGSPSDVLARMESATPPPLGLVSPP